MPYHVSGEGMVGAGKAGCLFAIPEPLDWQRPGICCLNMSRSDAVTGRKIARHQKYIGPVFILHAASCVLIR